MNTFCVHLVLCVFCCFLFRENGIETGDKSCLVEDKKNEKLKKIGVAKKQPLLSKKKFNVPVKQLYIIMATHMSQME